MDTHQLLKISFLCLVFTLVTSCGGSSGDSEANNISTRNINGFMLSSRKAFNADGVLLFTHTYSVNTTTKIITLYW